MKCGEPCQEVGLPHNLIDSLSNFLYDNDLCAREFQYSVLDAVTRRSTPNLELVLGSSDSIPLSVALFYPRSNRAPVLAGN